MRKIERGMMMKGPKRIDLTGRVFGRLRVLGYVHTNKDHRTCWTCECWHDDGTKVIKVIPGSNLTKKKKPTRSCGCLREQSENYKSSPSYQKSLNCRPTKDALRHLYWRLNMSASQITTYYQEHNPEYVPAVSTVNAWLRYYDIPVRDGSTRQKLSFKVNPARRVALSKSGKAGREAIQNKIKKGEYKNSGSFRTNPAMHKKALINSLKSKREKAKLRHAAAVSEQAAHAEMEAILNGETSRF
jgi:hypothetical protein